jgi:hypothetical protein
VVVGIKGEDAQRLDNEEPGWKISGEYKRKPSPSLVSELT